MTSLHDALHQIAPALGLDADTLIRYAEEDIVGGFHLSLDARKWNTGAIWEGEGQFVYALVRGLRPARVFEAGIGNGCTSAHILAALDANGYGELVSCDPYALNPASMNDHPRWTRVNATGEQWLDANPDATFEIAVEDTMHTHEMTFTILSKANRPGLRLALSHDAGHASVGQGVTSGFQAAFGSCTAVMIGDSDCGWGYWANPAQPEPFSLALPDIPLEPSRFTIEVPLAVDRPKVLYLPIIEPGRFHDVALANKRGLYEALVEYGCPTIQLDYLAIPPSQLFSTVLDAIDRAGITLLVTQLHSAEHLTSANLAALQAHKPTLRIVNWSGDSWRHSLVSSPMLDLARQTDLWLVAAPDVLPEYAEYGIHAAYWQIAYEKPVGDLPDMPSYDVVFLANVITDERRRLMEFLRSLDGVSVGIYGDWEFADGVCQYDFGTGEALYQNAKIAIADNVYPDQQNYVSNRPIQALVAGGAILLHQHVPKMRELLGIEAGVHYVEWDDFAALEKHIRTYLKRGNDPRRRKIVRAGQAYAMTHHTYTQRVEQLFNELLPEVSRA